MFDTNPSKAKAWTRRDFLQSAALASAAVTVPSFIERSAAGLPKAAMGMSSIPGVDEDRVLVVVQLSGGNDGLNTVVPFGDPLYYRARPQIGIADTQALRLGGDYAVDGLGLHPALAPVKDMYDNGQCALVQGIGYPNPNRSHFRSMDIWHTADTSATGDGWLGRYIDAECVGYGKGESGTAENEILRPEPPIAIGREAPLATQGRAMKPVAFDTPDLFRWTGSDVHDSLSAPYDEITRRGVSEDAEAGSNAAFLMRTAMDAQVSSEQIRQAVAARSLVNYPRSGLAAQLSMVANMIRAGIKTRVYYVSMGSFDTHSGQGGQNGRHAQLLGQFAGAVNAFYRDLQAQGNDTRVLTMSFSEFGRRVGQNASGGTDHGTAAPMMLFGPMVRAGVHGQHPSLSDLDNGDLKYRIDFRSVYSDLLENWLSTDSKTVLGDTFTPLGVVKSA